MSPLVWLVTGASSGFGLHFVESILAKGDKVIATARGDASRLDNLKAQGAAVLQLDVTSPQSVLDATINEAIKIYGHIDVLLNNAGYIEAGLFEELDHDLFLKSMMANYFGPLNLTRSVLSHMRPRRSGTLIFMSSISAHNFLAPGSVPYASAKAAIDSAVANMAVEIASWNIRICTLIPGMFKTNVFTPGNILTAAPKKIEDYAALNKTMEQTVGGIDGNQAGDPRKAANIVVDAVHGDGVAAGKTLPARLPLGPDALAIVRENCKQKEAICAEWEGLVGATNFD